MPTAISHPGVYIEEAPRGVHTIAGVATSITAFAGWTPRGPTNIAAPVSGPADFARSHGGLDSRSLLGYAVNQFFANGGQQAWIVRVLDDTARAAQLMLDGRLVITASSAGQWANDLAIVIERLTPDASRFRLTVANWMLDAAGAAVEVFDDLSMQTEDARFITRVLAEQSACVSAVVQGGATDPPADTFGGPPEIIPDTARLTGGFDGSVLAPDDPAFEVALLPPSGSGGLYLLDRIDLFNLLCVPGETDADTIRSLQKFCRDRRAFLIADCAADATVDALKHGPGDITGDDAINTAFYFPWINAPDPLRQNQTRAFPPSGFVAGIYARTDAAGGVWKAPAGSDARVVAALGVSVPLSNGQNDVLNPLAINCIRTLPAGNTVLWGARTLQGSDARGAEWRYVAVRRTALFIEESLYCGLRWVTFEPNDEPLWVRIRLSVEAFMQTLFGQGAFQGNTPRGAWFVKCGRETATQDDINRGVVNIVVGFAPLKPAEFVLIQLQQMAGQIRPEVAP